MSYETERFRQAAADFGTYTDQQASRIQYLETRLFLLEEFMKRAEPFIKAMELISPKPDADTSTQN